MIWAGEKGGASAEKVGGVVMVVGGGVVHVVAEVVVAAVVGGVVEEGVGSLRGRPRPYLSHIGLGFGFGERTG